MKKLLAVDLDGTLFYPQRRFALMTRKNLKFLKDFIADGNEVVVATGRNCRMLKKIEKKLGTKLTMMDVKVLLQEQMINSWLLILWILKRLLLYLSKPAIDLEFKLGL